MRKSLEWTASDFVKTALSVTPAEKEHGKEAGVGIVVYFVAFEKVFKVLVYHYH